MSKEKDVFWFRHDSNASRDIKLIKIRAVYDFWGIGVYWCIVEYLRDQPLYRFEYDESNMQFLSQIIGCQDFVKFSNFIKDAIRFNLFCVENGYIFSSSLVERMKKWDSCKTNGSEGGRGNKKPTESQPKAKHKANRKPTIKPPETIREEKRIEEYINNNIYSYQLKLSKEYYDKVPESKQDCLDYYDFVCWILGVEKYEKTDILGKKTNPEKKNLLKMRDQLEFKDFAKLKVSIRNTDISLREVFESMENWSDLKKRTSMYLTALTFIKNRKK